DEPRLPPRPGQVDQIVMAGNPEPGPRCLWVTVVLVAAVPHRFETVGQAEGIAVVAARRDTVAPGHRIPGDLCPLDACGTSHSLHDGSTEAKRKDFRWTQGFGPYPSAA